MQSDGMNMWGFQWMDGSRLLPVRSAPVNTERALSATGTGELVEPRGKKKVVGDGRGRRRDMSHHQSHNQSLPESNKPHCDKWHSKQVLVDI